MNISIITVGMNHLEHLKNLYASFYQNDLGSKVELIYVDNCSTDGSVEFLRSTYPNIRIIINDTPKGFGENNNIGANIATGKYLAILNPDIILFENSLNALLNFAESNPNFGIIAPKLLNLDMTYQFSVRRFITPKLFLSRLLVRGNDNKSLFGNSYYLCKEMDISKTQYINWAVGASFFISSELYRQLGGFDEDYFLYMEDEDLCLRSWKLGYPVVYYPESTMVHNHLRSSKKLGKTMFFHFESLFIFWRKHGFSISDYVKEYFN